MRDLPYIEKHGLKLSDKSFEDCFIDVGKIKEGMDALKAFPIMKDWAEFRDYKNKFGTTDTNNTEVIRFIVAFYDNNSPIRKHFSEENKRNWQERKIAAAEYAGFRTYEAGAFSAEIQKVMNGENAAVNAMTIRYCVLAYGPEFVGYVRMLSIFNEKTLQNPNLTATKIKLDIENLREYEKTILAGDQSQGLKRHFYKISTDEELKLQKLRPEFQAQYWNNKLVLEEN